MYTDGQSVVIKMGLYTGQVGTVHRVNSADPECVVVAVQVKVVVVETVSYDPSELEPYDARETVL